MSQPRSQDLGDLKDAIAELQQTLAQLQGMADQGLSVADAQAEALGRLDTLQAQLADLGESTTFDQREQRVDAQININIDRRQVVAAPGPAAQALRRAYLHRLIQQTRRLPLAGVDPKAASDEGSGDLQLAAVYTALLTHRTETADAPLTRARALREPRGEDVPRLPVLQVLNQQPHLVLLGDPGSGKSTFVNFVALCLAGELLADQEANLAVLSAPVPAEERDQKPRPQPWDHGPLLPLRVVLRDLAARGLPDPGQPLRGDTLWSFIVAELGQTLEEYAPFLKKELLEQGALILLDGLDEVPDAHQRRAQVKQVVQSFADDFPLCRFLVTSRTYAYQRQDWKLDGFAEVVLSPFTPIQVARFVERWYAHVGALRALNPEDAQGRAALLTGAIERSQRLAELAARPLLLTLMASLHAWRGGSLPEKREELYADIVDLLLDQWESPKVVRDAQGQPLLRQPSLAEWLKVERAVVRAELNRLAFDAHHAQPQLEGTADIPEEQLVATLMRVARNPQVNPNRLVEYICDRAGLLAARGERVYTFPHRTFQEYLAACHLTDHGFPDQLADLVRADPQGWREVALLAGAKAARGTASAVWTLAEALCFREPPAPDVACPEPDCWGALLAAQTVVENERERLDRVGERYTLKLERIRHWLVAIVARGWLPPVDRAQAGRDLAVLGDDRPFDALVTIPTGPFWMGDDDDDDAGPRHEQTLPAFKIGRYPVTNAQYAAFVAAGGYQERRYWTDAGWRRKQREGWDGPRDWGTPFHLSNHPVVGVSWYEALAYCAWLTGVWRAAGVIAGDESVRLPTEPEWEKAARGADGRAWPWGDRWDDAHCNSSHLGLGQTCAVGIFPSGASPFGCLDMAGQVWEWTASLWGEGFSRPRFKYPYDPADGREDLDAGDRTLRVLRGGSFDYSQGSARCAYRLWYSPSSRLWNFGFRVVVPISLPLPSVALRSGTLTESGPRMK